MTMAKRATIADALDHPLGKATDINVVVGPVQWHPHAEGPRWYFMVATCGPDGFRCDKLDVEGDADEADDVRAALFGALIQRRPLVVHDTDDELYMARLCETLWPGERITRLRQGVELERAQEGKPGC